MVGGKTGRCFVSFKKEHILFLAFLGVPLLAFFVVPSRNGSSWSNASVIEPRGASLGNHSLRSSQPRLIPVEFQSPEQRDPGPLRNTENKKTFPGGTLASLVRGSSVCLGTFADNSGLFPFGRTDVQSKGDKTSGKAKTVKRGKSKSFFPSP